MDLRSILHTEIEVSPICLGTMTFGSPVERKDAIEIVHWALDHDINFIDTADMYEGYDRFQGSPGGVAESILGEALKDRRSQAIITTKVGSSIGGDYAGSGLSRAHILHQIDVSLTRLQTDCVDIYEFHRPDPETPLDESVATMAELIEVGKVRYWGVSNFSGEQIREIVRLCDTNGLPRPVINQPAYSWLKRDEEQDSFPVSQELELSVTPYQPLQGGLLTGKYRRHQQPPADSRAAESTWLNTPDKTLYDRLDAFEAEARQAGMPQVRYAVDWLLHQLAVTSVVVGVKKVEQLREILGPCQ